MADFLELIPIDHPPFGDSVSALNATIDSQFLQDAPMSIPVSLKTARRFLGNLWLPNYLPEGFDIDNAGVTNSDREHPDLIFLAANPVKSTDRLSCLFIVLKHIHTNMSLQIMNHVLHQ